MNTSSILETLRSKSGAGTPVFEQVFQIDANRWLAAVVTRDNRKRRVGLMTNVASTVLHWGVAVRSEQEWLLPPEPRGGLPSICKDNAAQTLFAAQDGFWLILLEFEEPPLGISFVLLQRENGDRWIHFRGGNFFVPVRMEKPPVSAISGGFAALADQIVRAETTHNSWTLMHRFNLCHDMLERAGGDSDTLALLYTWLRFSAIRQLTWQRNYNTKPRELAHAQERLTQKLVDVFRADPASRPMIRLMLATVGRGGEGQRIRDEILNIMHRHHIKEVTGHFMEEWHQKLHNNTTPDDVVICEAYLEFLRTNGSRDRFYQVLQEGGVTRQRLQTFERPIRSDPDFVGWLKDGLIHDFQNFLKILKASHSGTDLETSINAARNMLDEDLKRILNQVWERRNDSDDSLVHIAGQISDARRRLRNYFNWGAGLREIVYLDLSLEQQLRAIVERSARHDWQGNKLVELIRQVLDNLLLSGADPEMEICQRHWDRLLSTPRFGHEWALHAKSVADRIGRALSGWIDRLYQLLQPKAEYLGAGFHAEAFSITLFSEEVVRGASVAFVMSTLLHHLEPVLRQTALLGSWQIVSRGSGSGKVEVVDELRAVQRRRFDHPVVVVTDKVMGDEDIPNSVIAVIAPDVTDIVSHVAVRARNAGILFAACYDAGKLQWLKSLQGRPIRVEVSPSGDVLAAECAAMEAESVMRPSRHPFSIKPRKFTQYAVVGEAFTEEIVGGKSCHLNWLRGRLPDWIHLPSSMALPFGVFEKVLEENEDAAKRCVELVARAGDGAPDVLRELRETVATLTAPPALVEAVQKTMARSGLPPGEWEGQWTRIKQVWGSKWNDRAFLSRARMGIPHENLYMAVLIQQVVEADYAFVIHTVNPSNGDANELFGELVLGLGETLVGNYPGRALSFTMDKTTRVLKLSSFPGKSTGLYGGGLIFRSDSNGEDLAGYAGAGVYDSYLLDEPRQVTLDYTREPLIWDEAFRNTMLSTIGRIGLEIERAMGGPQDIEGAVSKERYYVVQTRPQVGLA